MIPRGSVILAIAVILSSCSENKECCVIPAPPDPVEDPRLWLWSGQDSLLKAAGDPGIYTVSSDNEEVATAEVTDKGLLITAGKPGGTLVHINGGSGQDFTLEVQSTFISGEWENITDHETYEDTVIVEAENASFAAELKKELEEEIASRYGYGFKFLQHTNSRTGELDSATFVQLFPETHGTNRPYTYRRGTYSFSELTLRLYPAEGEEEIYRLIPYEDRTILGLRQDLTDHYRNLYPDKDVRKVSVTLHIRFRLPPG